MARIAKSGIEGLSLSTVELPSGNLTHRASVRRPDGSYETTSYPTEREARRGGIETLRRFNQALVQAALPPTQALATAPAAPAVVWFAPLCREYAKMQEVMGSNAERVTGFMNLAKIIEREGFGNLCSGTFGPDVLAWLKGLEAGWCNDDPNWIGRRKVKTELTMRYRNDLLERIGCVINYAINKEGAVLIRSPLVRRNGSARLWKFPVPNKMKPTFQVSELRAIVSDEMDHDEWWLPACLLTYTGCRGQEAMFLRWEWCDWDARVIRLQFAEDDVEGDIAELKTGERIIPMMDELYEVLQKVGPKPHGYILEDEYMRTNGSIKHCARTKDIKHEYTKPFRRYCKRAGVDAAGRTLHSLRHNYAAINLAMEKNFNDVMDALGHRDEETTLEYAKMRATFKVAVKGWNGQYYLRRDVPPSAAGKSSATG